MPGRVEVEGRHLRLNEERFAVRGTAYGPFAPRSDGARYPEAALLQADLEAMAATGLNTIRTFDVPPADLLNAAAEVGLRVLVGLDYPDWRFEPFPDRSSGHRIATAGLAAVDRLFKRVDNPSVVLAVSVGRTLPADLVRVHHPGAVAETLASIVDRVQTLDPSVLATYTGRVGDDLVMLDGCDLLSVVLDADCASTFQRSLVRLQQARPAKPLLVIDLDPPTSGLTAVTQARELTDRLNALDRIGCAGATVGAWMGEPAPVDEPANRRSESLVTVDGALKPLGRSVETWARQDVKDLRRTWPRVTALVTAHNSESTIERCLSALEMSDYPDLEVIVCDQGSTDRTVELAARYPFELLQATQTDGTGPTAGLDAATGDIVSFVDADVVCHRLWPWFIALAFDSTDRVTVLTEHLVAARETDGSVAHAVAALADLERPPPVGPAAAIAMDVGGVAVRRSALGPAEANSATPAGPFGDQLIRRLGIDRCDDGIGTAPAAQAVRLAPNNFGAVWRNAVMRGAAHRQTSDPTPGGHISASRAVGRLLSAALVGDRPSRPVALRAVLDVLVPPVAASAVLVAVLASAGASGAGLWLSGTMFAALAVLAFMVARDVVTSDRSGGSGRIATAAAVAAIVLLEPLACSWGRLRTRARPAAPANRTWTGDREDWLIELRWRLALAQLSIFAPANRNRWDIEVRCGLFLRKLIVAAVAWQWTPHVRTALRPRWSAIAPVVAVAVTWPSSPLIAAFIASATVGELAFELITLRRVDGVISQSIAGSLPPVRSTDESEVERAVRSTLDL